MKRWLGGLVASTLAIGACALAIHHIAHIFIRAESYNISFDDLLSVTAQQSMRSFIAQNFNTMTRIELVQKFHETFPCTASIQAHQKRPSLMHFSVHACQPWLRTSNKAVITTEGKFIEQSFYNTPHLTTLSTIHVPETFGTNCTELEHFFDTFKKIDPSILKYFSIAWNSPHHITLTDRTDEWFSITCAQATLPTPQQLAHCTAIKNTLKEQRMRAQHPSVEHTQADIRFAQQIIVSTTSSAKNHIVALSSTIKEKENNAVPLVQEHNKKGELYV